MRPRAREDARVVIDDLEGVLDPDVMPVAMAEAILDGSAASPDQRKHLAEGARRVVGMKTLRPALRVGRHLLRRIAHDGAEIFAHEGAGVIARRLGRVDDGRADGEKVLQTLARALELGGDRLALMLERLEIFDPLAQGSELVDELLLGLLVVVACGRRRLSVRCGPDVLLECLATLSSVHHSSLRWGGLRPA